MTDATREGVSEETHAPETELEDGAKPQMTPSPRLEAMKAIAESRRKQIEAEIIEGGGTVEEAEPEPPAEPAAPEDEPPPEPARLKIKVDGEEREVTQDEVIAIGVKALQKELAADKRLEEAARQKKANEEEAARIRLEVERMQRQFQVAQEPPKQDAPVQQQQQPDLYAEAVKKIQYGSEGEATEAVKALVQQAAAQGRPQGLTAQQVNDLLEFRESSRWLADEFKDVVTDPVLMREMRYREAEKRAAGDVRPYRELWAEIGGELREYRKSMIPAAPQTRAERKATVVTIPQASARPAAPTQPKELTPSDIVEQMRKGRGQRA